jgi:hypothetical protein
VALTFFNPTKAATERDVSGGENSTAWRPSAAKRLATKNLRCSINAMA